METGDPKQVAVLAVVAVGAVGFLLTRLGGKHDRPQTLAPRPAAATTPAVVAFHVVRDPFSHPRLATRPVKPPAEAATAKAPSFSIVGSLPAAEGPVVPGSVVLGPVVPTKTKAAKPKEAAPPPPTTIGLEAVAGASDAVAFLSVDGTDSRPFHADERVAGAIRLVSVGDGEVVLSGPKGKLTLGVGERKTL